MPILKYKNTKLLISIKKAVTNKALKQLNQWCTEGFCQGVSSKIWGVEDCNIYRHLLGY